MNFYFSSKVWDKNFTAPHSSKSAKPSATQYVKNSRVIIVKDASYRGATFSGIFLLGENIQMHIPRTGMYYVEVYCCWFGLRLKTKGPSITVDMSSATIIASYSGDVVSNISLIQPENILSSLNISENKNIDYSKHRQTFISKQSISFNEIVITSFLLSFLSIFLKNTVPINSFEWAYFFGKVIGMIVFTSIINNFFRMYGTIVAFAFYCIYLIYLE